MTNRAISAAACAAILLGAAQPCAAAEAWGPAHERRSGAFAGLYLRMPLGQRSAPDATGEAGLRMGMTHVEQSAGAAGGERRLEGDLVRAGLSGAGRPALNLAGRNLIGKDGRLSLQEDGEDDNGVSPWLIAGGVVVVGLGIGALVIADRLECKPHHDEC
ncbi:MAG TPA: hypothetical protein VGW34_06155 [Allosphingosinicella sp.]|nr:hypothetical protein [Allosphingosinicella sp.]